MPGPPTPWGTTLTIEVSSAAPGDMPVWVDISDTVRPAWDTATGRQSELSSTEPGRATLVLLNDGRYTTGNPDSVYPWWRQARRVRIRETVGYTTFDLFDGFVERPRGTHRIDEADADAPQDATVAISAVDLIGRLGRSARLISTLGAHIMHHGGPTQRGYWPMGGSARTWTDATGTQPSLEVHVTTATNLTAEAVDPGAGVVASADDLSVVSMTNTSGHMDLRAPTSVTLEPGETLTAAVWVNVENSTELLLYPITVTVDETPTATGTIVVTYDLAVESDITATLTGMGLTGTVTGPPPKVGEPTLIAVRYSYSPPAFALWVNGYHASVTPAGSAPTATTVSEVRFGEMHSGLIGHAQLYVGVAEDWTTDDLAAQYAMGFDGLEHQSTGERVRTLADYAGIPAGGRDIDRGAAIMTAARLAGRFPADALAEAVETEQGRLFVTGGRLTFRDRRAVHDI